ncbi:MAG TPA: CCA tRNA nucleotidyltransferase [Terriglobales bacterium]|nr:CCA tRNA nucleotidyltransferase [Terriglobales bacterium]
MLRTAAIEVIRTLRSRGHQAYLVGGCVRDLLLGREPADYDVATDALPQQVMHIFPETYAVGAQFGVVLVPIDSLTCGDLAEVAKQHPEETPAEAVKNKAVEVATFRNDGIYTDGRHPNQVTYSTDPREDVQRRDFTINGLLMDPLASNRVLDFVGGCGDLERQVVRAIGEPERRFREDKLRMLRAVRFAARFGFTVDSATFAAIKRLAPEIHQVSHERIREELTKMLTEGHAKRAFELLDESGLLHEILPEVEKMKGVAQPPQYHPEGDVFVHTLLLLDQLPPGASRTLAWGMLLHDVGKPPTFRVAPDRIRFDGHVEVGVRMAAAICRRLRMSNEDTEQILALVDNHMRFADVQKMKESTLKRFLRLPRFDEHLTLHHADVMASHGKLDLYDFTRRKLNETPPEEIRPEPLITGRDLIAAGYQPGPLFKEILTAVEDRQLEGGLRTKEDALRFIREEFQR